MQLIKQNGVEVGRVILNENIISQPKTEVIAIGTKVRSNSSGTSTGIFRVPAFGSVTSRFGFRWGRIHEGIDISGHIGDPIYAADGGTVIFSGTEGGYGNIVKIDHGNGYITYYGHNSKNLVKVGQKVSKGQEIAKLGNTGNSTGPHVHFQVMKNGSPVDPLKYLR
jgi:murein DD-endopeptidase MepM/ murein hydrolase activator NlpD